MTRRLVGWLLFAVLVLTGYLAHGYVLISGSPRWSGATVSYKVNTTNLDGLDNTAVLAALASAFDWHTETANPNIAASYAGATTTNALQGVRNGVNEVWFSNQSPTGVPAWTNWWDSGSTRLEADIVLVDGYTWIANDAASCSGALYIHNVIKHEAGHFYGLDHSPVGAATMYYATSLCATEWETLDADDKSGIEFLYKPGGSTTAPTAPSNLRVTAADDISIALAWTDNATDEASFTVERAPSGGTFSALASLGANTTTYTNGNLASSTAYDYRVRAVNAYGASAWSNVASATTTAPAPPPVVGITLTALKNVLGKSQIVDLSWGQSLQAAIYRNNVLIVTTKPGTYKYRDRVGTTSSPAVGSYSYQVCKAGTTTCSNTAIVTW